MKIYCVSSGAESIIHLERASSHQWGRRGWLRRGAISRVSKISRHARASENEGEIEEVCSCSARRSVTCSPVVTGHTEGANRVIGRSQACRSGEYAGRVTLTATRILYKRRCFIALNYMAFHSMSDRAFSYLLRFPYARVPHPRGLTRIPRATASVFEPRS